MECARKQACPLCNKPDAFMTIYAFSYVFFSRVNSTTVLLWWTQAMQLRSRLNLSIHECSLILESVFWFVRWLANDGILFCLTFICILNNPHYLSFILSASVYNNIIIQYVKFFSLLYTSFPHSDKQERKRVFSMVCDP